MKTPEDDPAGEGKHHHGLLQAREKEAWWSWVASALLKNMSFTHVRKMFSLADVCYCVCRAQGADLTLGELLAGAGRCLDLQYTKASASRRAVVIPSEVGLLILDK